MRVRTPLDAMLAHVTCDLCIHVGFLDYKSKPDSDVTLNHENMRVFGFQGLLSVEECPLIIAQGHQVTYVDFYLVMLISFSTFDQLK